MGKGRGSQDRTNILRRAIEELLPDTYILYKQVATEYDELGLPTITREAVVHDGTTLIPCRLQEYRTMRESFQNLGQDVALNYHELIVKEDSPLLLNAIVDVNGIEYQVLKIAEPSAYSPYRSALIVNLGEVTP